MSNRQKTWNKPCRPEFNEAFIRLLAGCHAKKQCDKEFLAHFEQCKHCKQSAESSLRGDQGPSLVECEDLLEAIKNKTITPEDTLRFQN